MRSVHFQIYGQSEPPVELLPLRAGPLTMLYDPTSGMIRRVNLGRCEVLHGLYAAVRDQNWGTVAGVIQETRREVRAAAFCIEFTSVHQRANIHFVWRGKIQGTELGRVRYEFDGQAQSTFLRNRIGFCVLHPITECSGANARQTRTDGSTIDRRFPDSIEPQIFGQSSFQQLRAVAHEVSKEVWAEVSFEGDTFEMEDQRNWTDASFKTYCTPLAVPFPVEIKRDSQIKQAVELRLTGWNPSASTLEIASCRSDEITLTIPDAPNAHLPKLGLGVASHGELLTNTELTALRRLKLSHLRADVRLADQNHSDRLEQRLEEAAVLDTRLEVALHLPREGEANAKATVRLLQLRASMLGRILALREGEAATTPATLSWVRAHLGQYGIPIGAGSDCNFCELTREHATGHLALDDADFLFWSVNPQVHAFDHLSIMETLEAQDATVQSARAFAAGRELVISPVTLKQRFNPVATSREPIPKPGELPPQVDPRQLSHFAAAWTLGSIVALTAADVASITYYETTGWRGVMERASGSPLPDKFPTAPGELFPMFAMFEKLAGFKQCAVVRSPGNTGVVALSLFESGNLKRTLVANLTDHRVHTEARWQPKQSQSFTLEPFAIQELSHHT